MRGGSEFCPFAGSPRTQSHIMDLVKRIQEEVGRLLDGLEQDQCAVCGRKRFFIDLLIYATRRYNLKSDSHTDFELLYCRDSPSCTDAVTDLPNKIMESEL